MAFARLADICAEYLHKGDLAYVEGKFQTRKYEKDGQDRYITEVIIHEMRMLGGKVRKADAPAPTPVKSSPSKAEEMEDDLPF